MRINDATFLVGIDFGDGETTASCIEIGKKDVRSLNILNASLPDSQKVESCIYKEKSGKWTLATDDAHFSSTSLRMNFKNRPSVLKNNEDDYDAFKRFVQIVFELILDNNKTNLHYDRKTGKRNFYLAIACPSRWAKDPWSSSLDNDTEVISYLQIIQDIIPVDSIIKESDAAFFHFLDQGVFPTKDATSLVIDYGSSTIDYTFFKLVNGEKHTESDGSKSTEFGASKVEAAILDFIEKEHQVQFDNAVAAFNDRFQGQQIKDIPKWEPYVRHYLKARKEKYYSGYLYSQGLPKLKFELDDFQDIDFPENCEFFNIKNGIAKDVIENKILKQYKERITKEFCRLASKCKPDWIPDFIMITGGASRMPWVEDIVRDCFLPLNPNLRIKVDQDTPSYVVSHGIVRYLRAFHDFTLAYDSLEKQITESYWLTDSGIRSKLLDAFKEAVGPVYSRELYSLLKSFENGDFTNDLRTLASKIKDFNANLSNYFSHDDIITCNKVATAFLRKAYSELVQEKVQEVFKDSFKLELAIPISINLSAILSNFYIDGNNYEDRVKSAYAPHTFTEMPGLVSLDTYRDSSDRHYIAEHYPRDLSGVTLSQNHWGSEVDMIRESVINAVHEARKKIPFTLY